MWYLLYVHSLTAIAKEVFGEAEVLPFGSSGNGLALANADMDVCVFLNTPEGSAEVSPVEFVERLGDRLEKDSEFENILQLKRARVPIVKLNHINGIACDIGYRNDLAIWNTRLLRAYTRIDDRMRDMVTVIKTWAKRRKINNPYTGSLSSYAYVLLVIHVLQRCGVLPNLQSIVAGNGKVPYWDCQGFNRYFFEDIPNLSQYWKPTPESLKQSVGELLYEFFRYFANDFHYVSHVVSIRCGRLLTKEVKEWTKEPSSDTKPTVRNRYLFCIEDPFELDHNIGRPVDRNSLYTIRGEFMRAAKLLSKNGDGAISRLCQERESLTPQEKSRSGNDHGDGPKDKQYHHQRRDTLPGTSHDNQTTNGGQGSRRGSSGRLTSFPAGEERVRERDEPAQARRSQGSFDGSRGASTGAGSGDYGNRPRSGRRSFTKRPANANEPRYFS
ncbi:MAG: hypothetical protein J3Q66DRAFT_285943 [Benniella sp.]|nr:MAG: hypothetical protein J3Q66DRAFT_285943 [Benniella sp.]